MSIDPRQPTAPVKTWFQSLFVEPAKAGAAIGVGMQASRKVTLFARKGLLRAGVPKALLDHPIARASLAVATPTLLRAIAPRVRVLNNPVVQNVLAQAQTFAVANVSSDAIAAVEKAVKPLLRPLLGLGGSLSRMGELPSDEFDFDDSQTTAP